MSHMLVDLQVRTDAARLLLYRTAWLVDQGIPCVKEASMRSDRRAARHGAPG
ncbi:MAG: hypothetical protein HYU42_12245 [Candidatus Rokubacteria bacterium]|nr:hypothetical protein [Candidatus Rokubacteria bacterium]